MQVERRKLQRYRVKNSAFAIINPEPVRLVPILDIAMGGLGVFVNNEYHGFNKASKLEIMVADCSFYLQDIPFEFVTEFRALPASPSVLMEGRRRSLKFGTLTVGQKAELKHFIRHYAQSGIFWQIVRKFSKALHPTGVNRHTSPSCGANVWQNAHRPMA
jgi:hypothetical protein